LTALRAATRTMGVMCLAASALASSFVSAQTVSIPRDRHAWGRFEPGAWTKVRKLTEEIDARGRVKGVNTTETKTTLAQLDDTRCVLQSEVTVEVSGKRFMAQPKTICVGYQGEGNAEAVSLKKVGTDSLDIGGVKAPCDLLEVTIGDGANMAVSTIAYSDRVAPYVLRRETKTGGATADQPLRQHTLVEVLAVEMPYKVLAEIKTVALIRTVQRNAKGTTVTLEIHCPEVPGGVVCHSSKEVDESGRTVRRSTLELTDYSLGDRDDAGSRFFLFHRNRPRRAAQSPSED
jgi:hypothetical protein